MGCFKVGCVGWNKGPLLKLHLARGGGSIMGSLYKVLLLRDSDPYI